MLALVSITVSVFAICVLPFMFSGILAVRDESRGRLRLTSRVCQVAAVLTVVYTLGVCVLQPSFTISTVDELIYWLAMVGLWDLGLMFCSSVFSLLGYLAGTRWATSNRRRVSDAKSAFPGLGVASEEDAVVRAETGNPYQSPRR